MAIGKVNVGSGGNVGIIKINVGASQPSNPKEFDIWIKDDINITNIVFSDKVDNTAKVGTLLIKLPTIPTAPNIKYLINISNRSNGLSILNYVENLFYKNGASYISPYSQIYIKGKWEFLSGVSVYNDGALINLGSASPSSTLYVCNVLGATPISSAFGYINNTKMVVDNSSKVYANNSKTASPKIASYDTVNKVLVYEFDWGLVDDFLPNNYEGYDVCSIDMEGNLYSVYSNVLTKYSIDSINPLSVTRKYASSASALNKVGINIFIYRDEYMISSSSNLTSNRKNKVIKVDHKTGLKLLEMTPGEYLQMEILPNGNICTLTSTNLIIYTPQFAQVKNITISLSKIATSKVMGDCIIGWKGTVIYKIDLTTGTIVSQADLGRSIENVICGEDEHLYLTTTSGDYASIECLSPTYNSVWVKSNITSSGTPVASSWIRGNRATYLY
ncbi:MAG: hypothetical protein RR782_02725 [Clostridium sp.]